MVTAGFSCLSYYALVCDQCVKSVSVLTVEEQHENKVNQHHTGQQPIQTKDQIEAAKRIRGELDFVKFL